MSGPPPPFRRRKPKQENSAPPVAGTGFHAVKSLNSGNFPIPSLSFSHPGRQNGRVDATGTGDDLSEWEHASASNNQSQHAGEEGYDPLLYELPETAIGEGVAIRGELEFDRLLRVDGTFEGALKSNGSIVVGRRGCLIADVNNMDTLIIDGGKLIGNIQVDRLIMRGSALLEGNFSCKSLYVGCHATITGRANVHSLSPEIIDVEGSIIVLEAGTSVESYYAGKAAAAAAAATLTVKPTWSGRSEEKQNLDSTKEEISETIGAASAASGDGLSPSEGNSTDQSESEVKTVSGTSAPSEAEAGAEAETTTTAAAAPAVGASESVVPSEAPAYSSGLGSPRSKKSSPKASPKGSPKPSPRKPDAAPEATAEAK